MRLLPVLLAIIVCAALYGWIMERDRILAFAGRSTPEAEQVEPVEETSEEAIGPIQVVALRSMQKPISNEIILRGRTEAARYVEVESETSGLVISDPLRKGAAVRQGQVLCQLDIGPRQANLDEARARLAEAELNRDTAEQLASEGYATQTRQTAAIAQFRSAAAAVERAEDEIRRAEMAAPFEGILESDAAEIGSYMRAGSLCARVIQLDPIKVSGFIPETIVDSVRVGQSATATLISGAEIEGRITFISKSADPQTKTFKIEVEAENRDLAIRDGITAEISILSSGLSAHFIPTSAMTLDNSGQLGVRAVVDGAARFYPARIVRDAVDGVWLSELPEELNVIVVGHEFVSDGTPVAVVYRPES